MANTKSRKRESRTIEEEDCRNIRVKNHVSEGRLSGCKTGDVEAEGI